MSSPLSYVWCHIYALLNKPVPSHLCVLAGGRYCEGAGLPEPTGDCAAGWFCSRGGRSRTSQRLWWTTRVNSASTRPVRSTPATTQEGYVFQVGRSAGRMKLSCVIPASVNPFIYLEERSSTSVVSTVSVFWQFATFWWSAILLLKKGKIYLVEEMW